MEGGKDMSLPVFMPLNVVADVIYIVTYSSCLLSFVFPGFALTSAPQVEALLSCQSWKDLERWGIVNVFVVKTEGRVAPPFSRWP